MSVAYAPCTGHACPFVTDSITEVVVDKAVSIRCNPVFSVERLDIVEAFCDKVVVSIIELNNKVGVGVFAVGADFGFWVCPVNLYIMLEVVRPHSVVA